MVSSDLQVGRSCAFFCYCRQMHDLEVNCVRMRVAGEHWRLPLLFFFLHCPGYDLSYLSFCEQIWLDPVENLNGDKVLNLRSTVLQLD